MERTRSHVLVEVNSARTMSALEVCPARVLLREAGLRMRFFTRIHIKQATCAS